MRGEKDSEEQGVSQEGAAGWGHARLPMPDSGERSAWLPWTVQASPEEGGEVTWRGSDTAGTGGSGREGGAESGRAGRALNINSSHLPAKSDQSTFHVVMGWTTDSEARLSLAALLLLLALWSARREAVSSWINLRGVDTMP